MKRIRFNSKVLKRVFSWLKRHKILIIPIVVIILMVGFFLLRRGGPEVLIEEVVKKDVVKTVSVTGDIDADSSVNLTFKTGGKLTYLGVKEGDFVEAYQTIATLDQNTALKNLKDELLDYSLQRNVFESTQNTYQNRKPEQALNDEVKRILQNNQYNLEKAVNSVELVELARQESILTTPISGIVTRADVVVAGVNITTTTTFTITDPSSLNFKMEVDEADIGNIRQWQEVEVIFDAFPNDSISLKVDRIDFVSHKTSAGGNAFYVKAKISEPKKYRVGMSGNADIIIEEKKNVLSIPITSVFDGNYVYLLKNNKFEKIKITLGFQSDVDAEVISGLSEGEKVVLDPSTVAQNAR